MITIDELRKHWRDKSTPCNIAWQYRDAVWRYAYDMLKVHDHGRKYRFRMLDRANKILCRERDNCLICSQSVIWPGGWTAPSRLDRLTRRAA